MMRNPWMARKQMTANRRACALAVALGWSLLLAAPVLASEGAETPSLFTGDLGNILWSLITFGLVLFVLGKFAWRPILGALRQREEFIRESLEKADSDRAAAERSLKEHSEKLAAAQSEVGALIEQARRDADALKRTIEEGARKEAAAMLDRAKREIGVATDTAVRELYDLSGTLATQVASRILRKELDPVQHERLIAESIEEIARVNGR